MINKWLSIMSVKRLYVSVRVQLLEYNEQGRGFLCGGLWCCLGYILRLYENQKCCQHMSNGCIIALLPVTLQCVGIQKGTTMKIEPSNL
jgi:hypothetical protein